MGSIRDFRKNPTCFGFLSEKRSFTCKDCDRIEECKEKAFSRIYKKHREKMRNGKPQTFK